MYSERNLAAMAFGMAAKELGWRVGWSSDPADPLWPVLVIDTPTGQVSWHIHADEATANFEKYEGDWDGHTTEEKNARLHSYFAANTPIPAKQGEGLLRLAAEKAVRDIREALNVIYPHSESSAFKTRQGVRKAMLDLAAALGCE